MSEPAQCLCLNLTDSFPRNIEIKPDFSDIEEKLRYYIDHPDEAQRIIDHAHEYIDQFRDQQRERLISLLVLQRYFDLTN